MAATHSIFALYHFCKMSNLTKWQKRLLDFGKKNNIKGTLLLADEGINGTISGPHDKLLDLMSMLRDYEPLQKLVYKESHFHQHPFRRFKVKLKKEIVTIGHPTKPATIRGTYVEPMDWNAVLEDPNVAVIDTRNDYEYAIGTFKNAISPYTDNFRQFPDYIEKNFDSKKHKCVAMFCTGGIRCEKASSYMLMKGFEEVLHLKGGILKYLEEVPEKDSLWQGECFVFDQRVAVTHGLKQGQYDQCFACRWAITSEDKKSIDYTPGISCPRCINLTSSEKKQRLAERQKQIHLAALHNKKHLGSTPPSPDK